MALQRTSTVEEIPADPIGDAVAEALADIMGVSVELAYSPVGTPSRPVIADPGTAFAVGDGPTGWCLTTIVRLDDRVARLVAASGGTSIPELLAALPGAGLEAAAALRHHHGDGAAGLGAALRRALRDSVAVEVLAQYLRARMGPCISSELVEETVEFLIELSSTRVESHDLTHGVVVADVLADTPRLAFAYPDDIRAAKRAPLLFDGQRSVLIVDPQGRARTELQRHRLDRFSTGAIASAARHDDSVESGSLVAEATSVLGGLGFFLRADRSIWTFLDGQPLLVRRSEHWTAFPVELVTSIRNMTGGAAVAPLVARAAFMISAQPGGAILAIVDDPDRLASVVSPKDRYDLRNDIDPAAMRAETRLHHLIDAEELDEHTLVRLAMLDGATVLDREGRLIAYGAIVTSADSQHEGARTAAAKTLSASALVVLKVSMDGDITIFRDGRAVTTLLGRAAEPAPDPLRW
jgi:hypothetical protein